MFMDPNRAMVETLKENDTINEIEQVTLRTTTGHFRNYLAVASIRTDTSNKGR